jgi:tocopherol O-methyltransferase
MSEKNKLSDIMITNEVKRIAEYYDKTLPFYKMFWHKNDESYALHYGFWNDNTQTLKEALLNENKFLADILHILPGMKILDAGCGIGGSSIWLAKNFEVSVIGITLSKKQLEKANILARNHGLQNKVEFQLQNFLYTTFPDNYFDIIWAVESVCHAENKKEFLTEAYRILKPKGKVIVADGVVEKEVKENEREIYKDFLGGLALPNLAVRHEFEKEMKEIGFHNIVNFDKTKEIEQSSKILFKKTSLLTPFAKIFYKLGLISPSVFKNGPAGIAQYKLVKSGTVGYAVFYGEK